MQANDADISAFLHETACPVGHQYSLVMVSVAKRLLKEEMPASYRLKFLEHLDRTGAKWLTPDMIATVEPICDKGYEIIQEAQKLGPKALDVYAEHFETFAGLNPSLIAALKQSPEYQGRRTGRHDY
jgi:hypothetical protein